MGLHSAVAECLNLLFADIATSTCLAGLRRPGSGLQAGLPAPEMLEACAVCTSGNAKPVDAVLKDSSDDGAWPGDSLVDLACAILQLYAEQSLPVGVSPMCTSGAHADEVADIAALEQVLRLFQVVGKVGRLFAWARCIFPVRDAVLVKSGVINAALAKALRMARKYIREADSITAGDSLAEVASLEGLPWIFQFAMLHTGCLSLRPPMSGCVRRSC